MTTKALLRFCREHGHSPYWTERVADCLTALNEKNMPRVEDLVRALAQARSGSFMDWDPSHPDKVEAEYLGTLWNALLGLWLEQMKVFRDQDA